MSNAYKFELVGLIMKINTRNGAIVSWEDIQGIPYEVFGTVYPKIIDYLSNRGSLVFSGEELKIDTLVYHLQDDITSVVSYPFLPFRDNNRELKIGFFSDTIDCMSHASNIIGIDSGLTLLHAVLYG